jgi:hypothetical protein
MYVKKVDVCGEMYVGEMYVGKRMCKNVWKNVCKVKMNVCKYVGEKGEKCTYVGEKCTYVGEKCNIANVVCASTCIPHIHFLHTYIF